MSGIFDLLMGDGQEQPQLTYKNMVDHILRDPQMGPKFVSSVMSKNAAPQDHNLRINQIAGEAAGVADPFAFSALQRLMGVGIPDQAWLNESHGLARKEQYRYK